MVDISRGEPAIKFFDTKELKILDEEFPEFEYIVPSEGGPRLHHNCAAA